MRSVERGFMRKTSQRGHNVTMKQLLKRALDVVGLREALWDTQIYRLLWQNPVSRKQARTMAEFYHRFAAENRLIGELWFDVGANWGYKSVVFLKLCSKLVAVEPDPRNLITLKRRLRFQQNATIVEAAVGSKPATLSLACDASGAYSTLSTKEEELLRRDQGFMGGGTDFREPFLRRAGGHTRLAHQAAWNSSIRKN